MINKKGQLKIQQRGFFFRKKEQERTSSFRKISDEIYTMVEKTIKDFPNRTLLNFNKRGQLKIQQMAFMLIAVTIFFALVGMFVLVIKFSDMKQQATDINKENAMQLVSKIANAPEFACGQAFSGNKINCIDADKVMALKSLIKGEEGLYKNFWGRNVSIEIRKIYPNSAQNINIYCTSSNYPECNILNVFDKNLSSEYSNFAILCRKESSGTNSYDKCEMARIMVEYQ